MDYAALLAEINNDPVKLGYAQYRPEAPGMICALLNAPTRTAVQSRHVTARTVLAECTSGAAILDALQAAAQANSAVKWAMVFMQQDTGIDAGHPVTRALINQLATGGGLSAAQADALLALAVQPASRGVELGLGYVTEADLRAAGVV